MTSPSDKATKTMKAVAFDQKGQHYVLPDMAKPVPAKGQLLVRVVASALDRGLAMVALEPELEGRFLHAKTSPLIVGWHFSGIVEAVADGVDPAKSFAVNTAVFGHLAYGPFQKQGSLAEYVVIHPDNCARKPDSISHEMAAASATECITALQALRDLGKLGSTASQPDHTGPTNVLIVGAGGGVGFVAVQIARLLWAQQGGDSSEQGLQITAVCRTKDKERVQRLLGPHDRVWDRSVQGDPISPADRHYDIIFDTPSVYHAQALTQLTPRGRYVCTQPSLTFVGQVIWSLLFTRKSMGMVLATSKRDDLELLAQWMTTPSADNRMSLEIPIDSVHAIRDIKAAIDREQSPDHTGRVVIQVQDGW